MEVSGDVDAIRREHLHHEGSVRGLGSLYYLSGSLLIIAGVPGFTYAAMTRLSESEGHAALLLGGAISVAMGALFLVMAWGLRRLRPWARSISTVVSCFGLFGFPFGTLIHGYILYLLHSKKGDRIFQDDYPWIIAATPSLKTNLSLVVWVAVALLIVCFAAVAVMAVLER